MLWWLLVLAVLALALAVFWRMDRRRRSRRNDGGSFDSGVNRAQGEGNARNYYAGPP